MNAGRMATRSALERKEGLRRMGLGEAVAIFKNIDLSKRKEGDKRMAIETVLGMETHNGITKQEFINAVCWLMERQGGAGEREDGGWIG